MSETFDLEAFINGADYPTRETVVYTNVKALKRYEELTALSQGLDLATGLPKATEPSAEELLAYEAELDIIKAELEETALTFKVQGMPFREAQEIADIFDDEHPAEDSEILELMEKTIVEVRDAKGATTSVPDQAKLKFLRAKLSPPEFSKIVSATIEVSFAAATYEAEVDAGFPGGGADVE